ncbi:MAG: ABC-ATPase domain-containing protein [Acidobacteriota bacterium]
MRSSRELRQTLQRIDGRGYKAYQDLQGAYQLPGFTLSIDHVQGDPFAALSRLSVRVDAQHAEFPAELRLSPVRRIALADFLTREFDRSARRIAKGRRGTGKSGRIEIECGGQEVLQRNSIVVGSGWIESRFTVGLPAAGRRVLARQAEEMVLGEIPRIVQQALFYRRLDGARLQRHVLTLEDQQALRRQLDEKGLVAFVADGSILPRRSGIDDRPLEPDGQQPVIPFVSPPSLRLQLDRPNSGPIPGMGLPKGMTLILGGGFHGKSTLLRALERSVYDHIPGDGREWVVTVDSAVKIRAEDGRSVEKVDISPFVNHLPFSKDTTVFSTENASGSTSQAANIIEALEMGAQLLLIDEDTSATNFMIRDARMQSLVAKSREPITPFVDWVRELFERHGTSTILVMGGCGDYFEVADQAILMDQYRPLEVSREIRSLLQSFPSQRQSEREKPLDRIPQRSPQPRSFDASRGRREVKIDARGLKSVLFGTTLIDLGCVEQLVDRAQTRAIGQAIHYYAERYASGGESLRQGLDKLGQDLERLGLDILSPFKSGNLARPRIFEIAAAVNRLRTLKVGAVNR